MLIFLMLFSFILLVLSAVLMVNKPEDFDNYTLNFIFKIVLVTTVLSLVTSISYIADTVSHDKQLKEQELLKEKAYECYLEYTDETCFFHYFYPDVQITKNGVIL